MIKIQLDPNGKEKLQEAAKKSAQQGKTAVRWLGRKIKQLKPTRKTVLKGGMLALLLGVAAAAGANYLPKMTGQSNITAVQAAQAAAVRAESPACRRRCSQQHHAPSGPSKHPRGLKPCEPVGVAAVVPVPGRRASEQSPEPVAPAVTTRPPPPGPLARVSRADDDRPWTGSVRRAGRRP